MMIEEEISTSRSEPTCNCTSNDSNSALMFAAAIMASHSEIEQLGDQEADDETMSIAIRDIGSENSNSLQSSTTSESSKDEQSAVSYVSSDI